MRFDEFKFKKTSNGFSIKYKSVSLFSVGTKGVIMVMKDHCNKAFLRALLSGLTLEPKDDKLTVRAVQLSRAYAKMQKKFYRSRGSVKIEFNESDMRHFIKAIKIIDRNETSYNVFLNSQVEGLSFANTFPKVSQLSTSSAEIRLLEYLKSDDEENESGKINRIELTYSDKNTVLSENPSYLSRYNAMKSGSATLQHAYFVYDCQVANKGFATEFVNDYIDSRE